MTERKEHQVRFGVMLRAARLGYYYVKRLDCFVRMTDVGDNFRAELVPNALKYLTGSGGKTYRALDNPEEILALSPVLSAITSVTKRIEFILDDSGCEV